MLRSALSLLMLQASDGFVLERADSAKSERAIHRWPRVQNNLIQVAADQTFASSGDKPSEDPVSEWHAESASAGIETARQNEQAEKPLEQWTPDEVQWCLSRTTNIAFLFKEYDRYVWAE